MRIAAAALILAWLTTTGCDKGVKDSNPAAPTDPSSPGSTINFAAVGASDVSGVGSSSPCLFFGGDCPNGNGYVFVAARSLRSRGFTVNLTNLGIPTAVISSRLQLLGVQFGQLRLGNFIDAEVPQIPGNATLVTVFAGANDVDVITGALGGGAGGSDAIAYINQQIAAFGSDYATLLSGIRSRAPSARVIVINLPNFAGIPLLAAASLSERQAAQRLSVGMTTTVINPLPSQGIRVIDLMCNDRFYQTSSYSSDGFHPNDAGYQAIADLLVGAITAASFANPPSSCAQMTLVP